MFGIAGAGHTLATAHAQVAMYHNALAVGATRGLLAASGIALAGFVIAAIAIRVRREDLAGLAAAAQGQPVSAEPAMEPIRT
jgi:hypothetical protein